MISGQQTKTKEYLQVKFLQFLKRYQDAFTRPEHKFLQDMCLGILKGETVINNKIALNLLEDHSPKDICKRFTRHLNKEDLGTRLQASIITNECHGFDMETGIIVDESDIIKPKAKKMEGLQKVRDGSTGKNSNLGYNLLNIIAFKEGNTGYQIKPLSSDLIARDMELDSISQTLDDRLVEINVACENKGVYLFDRGYDDRKHFALLNLYGMNYVVRSKGVRSLIVDDIERPFRSVVQKIKLNVKINATDSDDLMMCGIKRVKLRTDGHPKKNPETAELYLIVAKFAKHTDESKGLFYLLCDFPSLPNLSNAEIIEKAIRMYRIRWKIEEFHKHIKQVYGWEKMQLSSYDRLINMNQVLLLAVCFLYSLKSYTVQIMQAFSHQIIYRLNKWMKIYDFVYYKLSSIVALCFAHVSRYNVDKYKGKWKDYMQLEIPGLENGGM